ncbi:MAG: hypothetical protein IKZ92_10090 [Muribaculaceae bacterium]|nr:hypothetical protein [Muribaculaceae bacterium]
MKIKLLFIAALVMATTTVWAAPSDNSQREDGDKAEITVNVDAIDFGAIELGYSKIQTIQVTGQNLKEDISLTVECTRKDFYTVSVETITPETAADGAIVIVECRPYTQYVRPASLRLSSLDAEDVVIPLSASPYQAEVVFPNKSTQHFNANVGQLYTQVGTIRFPDAEIPTDPDTPVIRVGNVDWQFDDLGDLGDFGGFGPYSFSIEGDEEGCFMARLVRTSNIINSFTLAVTYAPKTVGTHQATLVAHCPNAGVPTVVVYLRGEAADGIGDVDDDCVLDIKDVTGMIDLLLSGDEEFDRGDVNRDGVFGIGDVVRLIDILLGH